MLNLTNLLASLFISMGVGSNLSTPICNEKTNTPIKTTLYKTNDSSNNTSSNQNINHYNETITPNNKYQTSYTNVQVNPDNLYATDTEIRYQLALNTPYINVVGNMYQTLIHDRREWIYENQQTQELNAIYMQNYFDIWENNDNYAEPSTRNLYVMRITPYNYNINTATTINLSINIDADFGNYIYGQQQITTDLWLRKAIYVSSQSNWNSLLGLQLAQTETQTIIDEIEDVNNGFYYTKNVQLEHITNNPQPTELTLNFNFEITPKTDNYIVIDLMPVVQTYLDNDIFPYAHVPMVRDTSSSIDWQLSTSTINISGTNIIPNGNYEVIDIPGLMWEILTMPFAFISQAFNLTLFPGTPYQVNIANLFLSILAVIVFIWLVSTIIKMTASAG